jgi:hypothetical protein
MNPHVLFIYNKSLNQNQGGVYNIGKYLPSQEYSIIKIACLREMSARRRSVVYSFCNIINNRHI